MIIVSQNGKFITEKLEISIRNGIQEDGKSFSAIDNENRTLGIYKTEERAKEVLQEITEEYLNCNIEYCGMGYVKNKVYEMPKE